MAFNPGDFIAYLGKQNETARTDKFEVHFSIPPLVAGTMSNRDLALTAENSELPGRDLQMIEYRHHAFIQRIPQMNLYGQAGFTFICTGKFHEKKLFDRWLDSMVPVQTGLVAYPWDSSGNHNYDTTITVHQFDNAGKRIYSVDLIDAVPTSVAALNQSWDNDAIHRLQVTFAFKNWTSDQTNYGQVTDFSNMNPDVTENSTASSSGTNNYTNE